VSAAQVVVSVREDEVLRQRAHVSDTGEPGGWLYFGDDADVLLSGSPSALSRLAVALLGAANAAERLSAERAPGAEYGAA
jgi:hypothetical protein